MYRHSITNQPIRGNEFDEDSDGEDADWMKVMSNKLIDEFIDINRGEKELMKLWNAFMRNNPQ